jgi:peptide/nickel transport system permease protein
VSATVTSGPSKAQRRRLRRERVGRLWRRATPGTRRLVLAGGAVTGLFAVVALAAPLIAPYAQDAFKAPQLERPSLDHLFGTTNNRFDVFSRVVFGARLAFQVVIASTAFALCLGVPLGLISGYVGGKVDRLLVLVMDALYAFPSLLLAIVAAFALRDFVGQGVPAAALSIAVIYVPQYFRVVRNHTLAVREEPFVDAARAMGAPPRTVITRYVAANVVQSVPVIFTVNAADAVLTLAGLGFLGYGVGLGTAEWGQDISRAISDVANGFWWTSLFPGLAILVLVTALTLLGEGINDLLNPRLRAAGIDPAGDAAPAAIAVAEPAAHTAVDSMPDTETAPDDEVDAGDGSRGGGDTAWARQEAPPSPQPAPPASEAVLALDDIRVVYGGGVQAVDGVSLALGGGESLGLVGESGCGKSTLARAALGLLPGSARMEGRVVLDGADLTADPDAWRAVRGERVSMVFQEPATRLNPLQRIESAFVETIRTHRSEVSRAAAKAMAREALSAVGVPPERARQYPHEFSGGMRQRIMIALAVVLEPRVVLADEPTTSLDVLVEAQVLRLLDDLRHRLGAGLLLVTHNLAIVAQTCDRVAVMYAGRVVEVGPVDEVFVRPRHPYTQGLMASVISLETTELASIPGSPPTLKDPPPGCRFAPRCPMAMPICREVDPVPVGGRHTVECHLYPPS